MTAVLIRETATLIDPANLLVLLNCRDRDYVIDRLYGNCYGCEDVGIETFHR